PAGAARCRGAAERAHRGTAGLPHRGGATMVSNSRTATGDGRFRPLNQPVPAAVEATARGLPKAMLRRGVYRNIAAIRDTWRIDDEWWRDEISRRYFAVELEGGGHVTIYHDLTRDAWYVQPYEAPRADRQAKGA